MNILEKHPDTYSFYARTAPSLILIFPIICVLGNFINITSLFSIPSVAITVFILITLFPIQGFVRNKGKQKEAFLFKQWGGSATVRYISGQSGANPHRLKSLDAKIKQLFPEIDLQKIRTKSTEETQEHCEHVSDLLRIKLRESSNIPLLTIENMQYGFNRNCLAIKYIGLAITFICLVFISSLIFCKIIPTNTTAYITCLVCISIGLFWIFIVSEKTVKQSAETYATRFYEYVLALP